MKGKLLVILIALLVCIMFYNCKQRERVPLNSIDLEVKIKRFDSALFSVKEVMMSLLIPSPRSTVHFFLFFAKV